MIDYREQFKSCGKNVTVAADVYIEHPEALEVGDEVTFMKGFYMMGAAKTCRLGAHVTFYPNCFIQGSPDRFIVADRVTFFPGTYISLGGKKGFVEIGTHSHFAPNCVLYGGGGLALGAYGNFAAHTVFATVGHDWRVKDKPMALAPGRSGPITLEEDVWICANVTITANTRIAAGCVIAANAVVTKDTRPRGIYAGVPAARMRDR